MQLDYRIRIITEHEGVDFFGVADLSSAKDVIIDQGGFFVADYPKAISIGIRLPDSVVDELPDRDNRAVAVNYKHVYDITNLRLDLLTSKLASIIQQEGHKALAIPASERYDDKRICAVFSHKLAANLAGLGWIGKSCLLVTQEAGPRVRWSTVLTDAPLEITGKQLKVKCENCNACVEICPVNAFTGESFKENEPREVRYDAKKCEDYLYTSKDHSQWKICGLCIYACPHGKK
ncbi:MAG: epoxyqueuosine reductase [Methanobacterium sp.]|uniref:4Fe-4S dicluster domain-containing protein n=1 Tax=Methanobacterium sp. TaxID=2164 RepID=UPI003D64EE3C|nr:epoxyqueuosine reductase [Methanobacterium sp.]